MNAVDVAPMGVDPGASASIVEEIGRRTKVRAIVLCGSRATGRALRDSDYDVLVVVPAVAIPAVLPKLRAAGAALTDTLGVSVSINPLPSFRLRHPGRTLLVWKALTEGVVLAGEVRPQLPRVPALEVAAARSYALSGLRYLLEHLEPGDLRDGRVPDAVAHDVRKALLHGVQLRLLGDGRYASSLPAALAMLDPSEAADLEEALAHPDRLETWIEARRRLSPWLVGRGLGRRSRIGDLQYLALSALAGRQPHPSVLLDRSSLRVRLSTAVQTLALSVQATDEIDPRCVEAAAGWLPRFLRPTDVTFTTVRDVVEREWPLADPLVGL
ncbi:MAG: nucleotidyltransferase family protein [Actinomycetota bacterium]